MIYVMGDFLAIIFLATLALTAHARFVFSSLSIICSLIYNLIMNRLTNELNFIIKMHALLRKFIARFFHFMVSLIEPLP